MKVGSSSFSPVQTAILPAVGKSGTQRGSEAAVCEEGIDDFRECHSYYPTGCSKAGGYDAYLNLLKNQLVPPSTAPFRVLGLSDFADLDRRSPRDLTVTNHAAMKSDLTKLGEGRVVAVNGYLYYAQSGGPESANCELSKQQNIDYHIGIGFDSVLAGKLLMPTSAQQSQLTGDEKSRLKKSSIVAEMTPHYRAQFQPYWSPELLRSVLGRQVRVTGQLLANNAHINARDSRASMWELHPVTQFQVCRTAARCDDDSPDWVNLEKFKPE